MTRPERELRLSDLLRSLEEHDIEYVIFGAVALGFYGYVRATADLDIVVRPTDENLRRVHDWLVSINARLKLNPERPFGQRERWGMFKGKNATVLTDLGQVDVVQSIPGMPGWDDLVAASERYEIDQGQVAVMNRATLVEMKRGRSSKQDIADIEAIAALDSLDD